MTPHREAERKETRRWRIERDRIKIQQTRELHDFVSVVLQRVVEIFNDIGFENLLRRNGIAFVPELKLPKQVESNFGHSTLHFVVAWTFFYPLLSNRNISSYLEAGWPGFISSLKDGFILLVSNGPFPQECRTIGRPVRTLFPGERLHVKAASALKSDSKRASSKLRRKPRRVD